MPSTADLRAALAAALQAIPDIQVSAYALWNPTPPCLYVEGPSVEYDAAMGRGHDDWTFTVTGLVATASDIGAQKRLDLMLDPTGSTSVKTVLEESMTLGGVVDDITVLSAGSYQEYRGPDVLYLGAKWTVNLMVTGR